MNKISKMQLITKHSAEAFIDELTAAILEYEKDNLEVEIHYSNSDSFYTALVIGKEICSLPI